MFCSWQSPSSHTFRLPYTLVAKARHTSTIHRSSRPFSLHTLATPYSAAGWMAASGAQPALLQPDVVMCSQQVRCENVLNVLHCNNQNCLLASATFVCILFCVSPACSSVAAGAPLAHPGPMLPNGHSEADGDQGDDHLTPKPSVTAGAGMKHLMLTVDAERLYRSDDVCHLQHGCPSLFRRQPSPGKMLTITYWHCPLQ